MMDPPMRLIRALLLLAGLSAAAASPASAQRRAVAITGVVSGPAQAPIAGALVTLDSANALIATRTGADGRFRFPAVPRGRHELRVSAVGYGVATLDFALGASDTTVAVVLQPLTQQADTIVIRARLGGVFGNVYNGSNFLPIAGVTVQVLGSGGSTVTDTVGRYVVPKVKGGNYLVRFTHPGFAERTLAITVPRDSGYELSPLLTAVSATHASKGREQQLRDLDARLRFGGSHDVFVPRRELGSVPRRSVLIGLEQSMSFRKALLGNPLANPCVFVDGRPLPGWAIDAFSVGEIEAVEIHDNGTTAARRLAAQWPLGAPCGTNSLGSVLYQAIPLDSVTGQNLHTRLDRPPGSGFVVIWLRR
jgi:Carboxypeptidase regulatory-like domain